MAALVFIVIVVIAASSGAVFKPGEWYESLRKPAWTPPKWAFPAVWTLLYAAMAYAGWQVWTLSGLSLSMAFWGIQIIVNAMWSWMFFGLRRMRLALVDIIVLWASILGFILTSWPISELAAALFLPYLAWVTIAGFLNYSVLRLNGPS